MASLLKLHQDIATNFVWLQPLVSSFPESVPGTILMTDIWLYLDRLLDEKLFVAKDVPKQNQAASEAGRCKKLMGALRYLYRNSIFARRARAIVHAERVEAEPELFEGEARLESKDPFTIALRDASEHESDGCEEDDDVDSDNGDDNGEGDCENQEEGECDEESENEEEDNGEDGEDSEPNPSEVSPLTIPANILDYLSDTPEDDAKSDEAENSMDNATTLALGDGVDVAPLADVAQESSESEDHESSSEDDLDEKDGDVENDLVTPPKRPAVDTEALDRKIAAKSDEFHPDDLDNMRPEAAWKCGD
eukprot:s1331_g5.t1